MATGYIVWDSKKHQFVAGPFATSAEATKAIARIKTDGAHTASSSKGISSNFTTETVTLN